MSLSLEATPAKVPYPVSEFLGSASLSPIDLLKQCTDATQEPCRIPVNVGLFFDGTHHPKEFPR